MTAPHLYANTHTFIHLVDTQSIPARRLLALDGFAFDVDELRAYAEQSSENIYRNPHAVREASKSFSAAAIQILRQHPVLSPFALAFDRLLANQSDTIKPATINAVLKLVKRFDRYDVDGSALARHKFNTHMMTLNAAEQRYLNNYIINVKSMYGGNMSLSFEAAIDGGNRFDSCIVIARIYLWQFVIDFRPEEMRNIPGALIRKATRRRMEITPNNGRLLEPLEEPPLPGIRPHLPPVQARADVIAATAALNRHSLFGRSILDTRNMAVTIASITEYILTRRNQ